MSSLGICAFWNKRVMKMLKFFIVVFKFQGFFIKDMMFKGGRMSREKLLSASPK